MLLPGRDTSRRPLACRPASAARLRSACAFEPLERRALFAFGLTETASSYVLDTGGKSVFTIAKVKGELTSIKYNNAELMASFASTQRYSHYESGLSSNAIITPEVDPAGQWAKVTCNDSVPGGIGVTHVYVIRNTYDNLYMASLPVTGVMGEGRFITYLSKSVFTNIEEPSNISANNATVEGSDVFANTDANGKYETRSKYYNTRRMIENEYHGVTGTAGTASVGAWMNMGNREHSSGGPFFKDIDFQTTGGAVELYNCVFTGHTQTEPLRYGLQGPYAMQFTDGRAPASIDYGFMDGVGIPGLTSSAARGSLTGKVSGVPAGLETTVALSNARAQYWTTPDRVSDAYTINGIEPGVYTETLYQEELAVGTRSVTIAAGQTTSADIVDTYYRPAAIWKIGTWDGTPIGLLNADKIETMHPSDSRMVSTTSDPQTGANAYKRDWVKSLFTIGVDADKAWPMTTFKDVNNDSVIAFELTAAQAASPTALRIGLTLAFAGARPRITVNAGQPNAWTSAIVDPSNQPDSRGITRGTWRGNNVVHSIDIPPGALSAGTNRIAIYVISGQTSTGYLSPSMTYDAIDLVPTASLTNAPRVASISIAAGGFTIGAGGKRQYTAVARDQFNNLINANIDWTTTSGTITNGGLFTAPASGSSTITAAVGAITASTTLSTVSGFPILIASAAASTNVVYLGATSGTATLSVGASDDAGESNLTYAWTLAGPAPAPVTFSANGSNAAKNTLVTFTKVGTYTFNVTITDATGRTATSQTAVVVRAERVVYSADVTTQNRLIDASNSNRDGTLIGDYDFAPGVRGNAAHLTGGYLTLPNGIVNGLTDFTIGTWVRIDAQQTWARVFDFGSNNVASMFLTARAFGTNGIRFVITNKGGAGEQVVNGPALATGIWTHIAVSLAGSVATLYVNGVAVGTNANITLRPADLGFTTQNFIGKSQYDGDPNLAGSVDDFRLFGRALSTAEVATLADITSPIVASSAYQFESSQRIAVTFGENVIESLDAADFIVTNVATGIRVPASEFTLDRQTGAGGATTATLIHLASAGVLPDGNYRVTLAAGGVSDVAGNGLSSPFALDFAVLQGDADRDRDVDFDDLLTLAKSYGQLGRPFSQGNFDYSADGLVGFDDLLLLASRYGTALAMPVPLAATATSARATARQRPIDGLV